MHKSAVRTPVAHAAATNNPSCLERGRAWSRAAMRALLMLCLAACTASLAGCKDTDTLKEILYDQASEIIEQNSDQFVWVYDPQSELITSELPEADISDDTTLITDVRPRALYSSSADEEYTASQFIYDDPAEYDCESTGFVTYFESDEQPPPPEEPPQDQIDDEVEEQSEDTGSDGQQESKADVKGNTLDDEADHVENKGAGEGAGDGGDEEVNEPAEGGNSDNPDISGGGMGGTKPPVSHFDGNSEYGDIPEKSTVAAYGPYAVAVMMLTGGGALVGADADLLDGVDSLGGGFQQLFAAQGAANVSPVWVGDGTDSAAQLDMDALLAANPDAIFIQESGELTDEQSAILDEAGIDQLVVPRMASHRGVMNALYFMAQVLQNSDARDPNVDPAQIARTYEELTTGWLGAIEDANGGYTAHRNEVLDDMDGSDPVAADRHYYTLVVDQWNTTSVYQGDFNGFRLAATQGVALAKVGHNESPLSYYMGVGGVVNVAGVSMWKNEEKGRHALVWQFGYNCLNPNAWDVHPGIGMETSGNVKYLLNIPGMTDTGHNEIDDWEYLRAVETTKRDGLGSDNYPIIIFTTHDMCERFLTDSTNPLGYYYPHPRQEISDAYVSFPFVGEVAGNQPLYSFIGQVSNGQDTVFYGEGARNLSDCALVNPSGLCCDWTLATPESVLEAPWVASLPQLGGSTNAADYIAEFYRTFYRYELSADEIGMILRGREA